MSEEILFGKGFENPFSEFYTGKSYLNILSILNEVMVASITFEPGCRSDWHIHRANEKGGQIMLVTNGEGWYQEEGHDAQKLKPGDVVAVPANVKHWQGATKDSWFTHLFIEVPGTNPNNEWYEKVSDEEYDALE